MACIRKYGRVWQAQVRRKGVRSVTKSFRTKSAAAAWAKTIESEIERGWLTDFSALHKTTIGELLARYETEILPTKRAQASERSRIKRLSCALGAFSLVQLSPTELARYRNERLKSASTQTVRHELSLLRRIINVARSEWGVFLPRGNPAAATALPKPSPGRTRRLEGDEEARLLHAVVGNAVMAAIIGFALETALRRREIAELSWACVNLASRTAHISTTKTGIPRTVPLSSKAAEVLQKCDKRSDGLVFGVRPDSITQAFERACRRAQISNLRFHDLRHEATSRLFEKGLTHMEVSAITGHRDLRMLHRYTHLRPELIAKKLND